jgi:hypothetical protein
MFNLIVFTTPKHHLSSIHYIKDKIYYCDEVVGHFVLKKVSSYSTLLPFLASVAPNSLPPSEPLPTPKTKTHHPIAIDQNHTKKSSIGF